MRDSAEAAKKHLGQQRQVGGEPGSRRTRGRRSSGDPLRQEQGGYQAGSTGSHGERRGGTVRLQQIGKQLVNVTEEMPPGAGQMPIFRR